HVIQVRVVVDQSLHLSRKRRDIPQQRVDSTSAFVERGQQRLRVDQQPVHLLAAVTEDAGHLVGLGEQMLDLLVAFADGVGELGYAVQGGTEVRVSLVNSLRQHVQ